MQIPVSFENEGQKLFGMIHIPEGHGPWPAVVLCHGFTGHRMESHLLFVKLARRMCEDGIAVLRFDFRGSGESEGLFEEMTAQSEISDAGMALEFLANYPGIDVSRVGMLGFSMGGLVAIHAGPADPRVKTMVLWAPAVSLAEGLARRMADHTPDERGRHDLGGNVIGPDLIALMSELKPFEAIRAFKGSMLILHGAEDQAVPPPDSRKLLAEATCAVKKREIIPGADHCFSSEALERTVIEKTAKWFKEKL